MNFNNDFKFDLMVGQTYENQLSELLQQKIEVKRDFKCLDTGNIFVEYESRGKRSGIATSEAEWWCYWLSESHFVMIKKDELKKLCRKYIGTKRDVNGGDSNTSKGILLPIQEFINKF
jgi:hypothetical protein